MPKWRNGRRAGLKIRYPQRCVGSSPTFGTFLLDFILCCFPVIIIYEVETKNLQS